MSDENEASDCESVYEEKCRAGGGCGGGGL